MLSFASCSTSTDEDPNQIVLDALIIASDSFHNPSDVRLLGIGDSQFHYDENAHAVYECVKVRLQGANKVGGVSDGYYLLCLSQTGGKEYAWSLAANKFDSSSYYKKPWDECPESEYPKDTHDTFEQYRKSMINHYLKNDFFSHRGGKK